MENNGESNSGNGSFRLGLGVNEAKVHTVELSGFDTQSLLLDSGGDDVGEEREKDQKPLRNSLSPRQMKSLLALCDTILPSIKDNVVGSSDEAVTNFYRTSASMAGTHERVLVHPGYFHFTSARYNPPQIIINMLLVGNVVIAKTALTILGSLISEKLKHPSIVLMPLTLWLLSTWFGTFIFCGMASVSTKFPFFHSFPELSAETRKKVMQSWSLSCFRLFKMFFRTIKLLTLFLFFTQLDEAENNPSWKAIGYSGPDPQFKAQEDKECDHDDDDDAKEVNGPLYKGLVHLNYPQDIIKDSLRRFGFPVSVPPRKNKASSISSPSLVIQCDAVVVGSGAGGGVVAGVLAKAGYKVLVLEKGSYFARNNLPLLEGHALDQMYLSSGMIGTDDMSVLILAGSTVGGGSAINWSASIKTPQHVCKEWCDQHELELFESKLYKEAMDAVCEKMGVQSDIEEEGFNNAVLRKGCQEMGYPVSNIPRNAPPDHYCGWCCMGCKDGKKKGTSETWLVDLVKSGNGAILPNCEAIQVLHKKIKGRERKVACGVAFEIDNKGNKEICVVESKVTIVACGALSTPSLLKRSGLKNENIGRNLHLHPVSMAWGYFPEETASPELWPEEHKKSYEGGIMTAMSTVVADFNKTGYGAIIQTPSLHPGMFSLLMPWISGKDIKDRMLKFSRTAHVFALARDQGSGTVISPNNISYHIKDVDKENLNKGIEKVLRILAAAGAEEIGTHHNKGRSLNVKKVSYHEFDKFVKEESSMELGNVLTPLCSAHQMGSCCMGNNAKESVVNQMGETWEVEGLYVADSSVFPTALGVNPMVTVQAIAYCTAQHVLQVLNRKRR